MVSFLSATALITAGLSGRARIAIMFLVAACLAGEAFSTIPFGFFSIALVVAFAFVRYGTGFLDVSSWISYVVIIGLAFGIHILILTFFFVVEVSGITMEIVPRMAVFFIHESFMGILAGLAIMALYLLRILTHHAFLEEKNKWRV